MEYATLINSGIGAVLGFALAQLVNGAKLIWDWWFRPRLVIEPVWRPDWVLLSHAVEVGSGELRDAKIYAFSVRNAGRSIATGVRAQLIKIASGIPPKVGTEHAYDLAAYAGESVEAANTEFVLVPNASITIELARWREGIFDPVFPSVSGLPHHYEELDEDQYQFTVVAFDDKRNFVSQVVTVQR